ncbi:MAG: hypothetical protein KGS44_06020 [Alphaproteobacteria bacterium]|jgi:hypothetical protein|nr:hypothetical protein [Alphaproteobacteria bacterium]
MIRMFAAAAAAVALTGVAFAQEEAAPPPEAPAASTPQPTFVTTCPALPAPPALPDGAVARERDMAAGEQQIQAWNATYVQIINECRQAEVRAFQTEMQAKVAEARVAQARYQAAIAAYQADSAAATAIAGQWVAEVEEFNNRSGRRN